MEVSAVSVPRRGRVVPQRGKPAAGRSNQVRLIHLEAVKKIATTEKIQEEKPRRKSAAQRPKRKSLRARKLAAWRKRKARRKRWAKGQRGKVHRRLARVVVRRPAAGSRRHNASANPAAAPDQAAGASPQNLAKPAGESGAPAGIRPAGNPAAGNIGGGAALTPPAEHPGTLKHPFAAEAHRGLIHLPDPFRTGGDPAAAGVAVDTAIGQVLPPGPEPAEPAIAADPAGTAVPEEMFTAAEVVAVAEPLVPSRPGPESEVDFTPAPVAVIAPAERAAPEPVAVHPAEHAAVQEQAPAQIAPAAPELNIVLEETMIPDPAFIHILQSGTEPVELGNEWRQVESDESIGSVLRPETVQALAAEVSPPSISEPADGGSETANPGSGAANEES
ncbi:MAG: hypothetical protein E7L01_18215 [Paenibacillus macerans]|uniref:hypothetical protein n=1 Tax=Paenibacillus TaxID=44249 RepID=UPI002910B7BA|nr:hypothetical protein [Paenibacillus macerans]MDU7475244.1 hypothetical protein [Paenibacillus macerans]